MPAKKKISLAERPIIIYTGLFFGLCAAIAAAILIVQYFTDKPSFYFAPTTLMVGDVPIDSVHRKTYLLLTGSAINNGTKKLLPRSFEAKLLMDKKEFDLTPEMMPQNFKGTNDSQSVTIKDASATDLQATKIIEPSGSVIGNLLFSTLIPRPLIKRDAGMRIICTDQFGKQYISVIASGNINYTNEIPVVVYPKEGITITSTGDSSKKE